MRHLLQEGYLTEVKKKQYLDEDWSALLDDWSEQDSLRHRILAAGSRRNGLRRDADSHDLMKH